MNNQFIEARELIAKAREALRRGDKASARQLGEQAAVRAPEMEDVWLVLAASDPNPRDALAYAQKALELNPQSARAHRGVEWASGRLKQAQVHPEPSRHLHLAQVQVRTDKDRNPASPQIVPNQVEAVASLPKKRAYQTAVAMPALQSQGRNWFLPALLIGAGCLFVGFFVLFVFTSPTFASIVHSISAPPASAREQLWAPMDIAKPEVAPIDVSAFVQPHGNDASSMANSPQSNSSLEAVPTLTSAPTATGVPTEASTATPAATETPGTMALAILQDTPTSEYIPPASSAPKPSIASSGSGVRWIDVDLTNQAVYAYEGDTVVNSFIVSTGTAFHPTVTGQYKIYIKLRSGSMSGPGYFLPNVPYIMYFYKSYGLHGTYWHHNFGTPMSHGCVNLQTDDAAWLYNWASLGTLVNVHY